MSKRVKVQRTERALVGCRVRVTRDKTVAIQFVIEPNDGPTRVYELSRPDLERLIDLLQRAFQQLPDKP